MIALALVCSFVLCFAMCLTLLFVVWPQFCLLGPEKQWGTCNETTLGTDVFHKPDSLVPDCLFVRHRHKARLVCHFCVIFVRLSVRLLPFSLLLLVVVVALAAFVDVGDGEEYNWIHHGPCNLGVIVLNNVLSCVH